MGGLPRRFYRRPCVQVARALLGCTLTVDDRSVEIVETEAYLGPEDLASHARFHKTERTRVMWEDGGTAYVYLCYGIHEMCNVVADVGGRPAAVLLRAGAVSGGGRIASGPGKLCRYLGIDRRFSGADVTRGDSLVFTRKRRYPSAAIASGPRIGVDYAGVWAKKPLRFWVAGNAAVSR